MKQQRPLSILLFQLFLFPFFSFSQNPLAKHWDYRFGGTDNDFFTCMQQTSDGGYILGGYSDSGTGGDKTQDTVGGYDYWIVKTDALGNKEWDKNFGGTGDDRLMSLQQTADGGYILGGWSDSGISGDKTQASQGSTDYWIVKTDSLGNIQWDKDFGGVAYEEFLSLRQTADRGYILGGWSISPAGGDKTQPVCGANDYWIIKTDSLGNIQWDKDFGGNNSDYLLSLQQTADGGFILGGRSNSIVSCDKTQTTQGTYDYWIVKTDVLGNKEWDKDFGGSDSDHLTSLQQTTDAGYILGGSSWSGVGGDKTQPGWGSWDYWVIKADSLGVKQWDKDFGGSDAEEFFSIFQTPDGGYLLSGDSYSDSSGDKSENNLGIEQAWVVKTDSSGIKLWDKTVSTNGHDETCFAIRAHDGCYVIANFTNAGTGGEKTEPSRGAHDYWFIRFCDTTQVPVTDFTSDATLCPGACTDFMNLTLNATSYHWSFPGALPDTSTDEHPATICYPNPGIFDVILIATNASGSDTLAQPGYITVFPYPPAQNIFQSGDTLFSNTGFVAYQWFYQGDTIAGATGYFHVALQSGDYSVVCLDSNGCSSEAVVLNVVAGLPFVAGKPAVEVHPNPVSDGFVITGLQGGGAELQVLDVLGRNLNHLQLREGIRVDVSFLPEGIYFLQIVGATLQVNEKIVVQR